jgi:hypothetical protein
MILLILSNFLLKEFLFRSYWTLANSGGAYMKLHQNGSVYFSIKPASPPAALNPEPLNP